MVTDARKQEVNRRFLAVETLLRSGDPNAVNVLCDILLKDPYPAVRVEAAMALHSMMNNPRVTEAMILALHDSNFAVRKEAANFLGIRGDSRALPELERLARKLFEDKGAKEAAHKAIERIKANK